MNKIKVFFLLILIVLLGTWLRLYKLGENPPSLYWDEVSLGYNAFSILTSGHDEHGEFLPISRFIAFGDYKPPGYIYSIVPFMAVMGVSDEAVRFPSVVSGIVFILVCYYLVREIGGNSKLSLLAAFTMAFSPWSLQLSRASFEAHLASVLNALGVLFFLKAIRKPAYLLISTIFFIGSFYTFNANRIIAPLLVLMFFVLYRKEILNSSKWLLISVLVGGVLLSPSVPYLLTRESRLRFQEVSIFNDLEIIKKSNERIERSGNTLFAKIIHNRRVYFGLELLKHLTDHFKGDFLFIKGDRNPRLSIQTVGELYWFELPLLILGVIIQLLRRSKSSYLLFGWLAISLLPAATARETPHMLRIASSFPVWHLLIANGWLYVSKKLDSHGFSIRAIGNILIVFTLFISVGYYFHQYWRHYPIKWSGEWQYGYKELVEKVRNLSSNYDKVYIVDHFGRPYIYFLFYGNVHPNEYLSNRKASRDWYGFWEVEGFGKYSFGPISNNPVPKSLIVTGPGKIVKEKLIDTVKNPQGDVIFEIGSL